MHAYRWPLAAKLMIPLGAVFTLLAVMLGWRGLAQHDDALQQAGLAGARAKLQSAATMRQSKSMIEP